MKAIWNGTVVAESGDTVLVEGDHYFPESALKREYVVSSNHRSTDPWKGEARYHSLLINGEIASDVVWYYPNPPKGAEMVAGRVAFARGVKVVE